MKNILITGATSFIGKNLVKKLLELDCQLILAIRDDSKKFLLPVSDKISFVILDLSKYNNIDKYINKNIDVVYHLAWNGTRGNSRADENLQKKNYVYSCELLKSVKKLNVKVFISAGSQAEYGNKNFMIKEETIATPNSEYGKYKLKFYEFAKEYCYKNNISFKEPRFFSLYGPDDNENTIIKSTLNKLLKNEECDFTDCKQKWNFLYIDDAVEGLIKLGLSNCKDGIYNFGSRETKPLKDYIEEMVFITKSKSRLNFGVIPHNDSGEHGIDPDISKLVSNGWKQSVDFYDGIIKILKRN